MKENKCCFHCLYCKPKEGRYFCSYLKGVTTELPAIFETCCEYFECFQCVKHNKEHCWCYGDIEIKSEDIIVNTKRPEDWVDDCTQDDRWIVEVTHKDTGIKVSNSQEKSQKKNYEKCIEDLKILLEENGYE